MIKKLGIYFINGFITLLPIILTIWILTVVFNFVDGIIGGFVTDMTGHTIKGIGILSILVLSFIIGWLSSFLLGKELVYLTEEVLNHLPIVNSVYSSVKKINEVLFQEKGKKTLKRVCAVEYPRKGIWSLGFMTGEGVGEVEKKTRKKYYNVFIPNTPAPATGFMIIVPKDEVLLLNMSIEDAIKIIVSGGVLDASERKKKK